MVTLSATDDRGTETIVVQKDDLLAAWQILEKLAVSLHRIGSHYATSGPDEPLSPALRAQMLEAIDAFFTPELMREVSAARRGIVNYLPADETEALSDNLDIWRPRPHQV